MSEILCQTITSVLRRAERGINAIKPLQRFIRASFVSTSPYQRPDRETARNTGKRAGEAAKVGGEKALAALRRSFVAITAARYFSEAGKDPALGELRRHDQQLATSANLVRNLVSCVHFLCTGQNMASDRLSLSENLLFQSGFAERGICCSDR